MNPFSLIGQLVPKVYLSFPSIVLLKSLNSVTKKSVITVKGCKPATPCVRDQDATTQHQQAACERQDN